MMQSISGLIGHQYSVVLSIALLLSSCESELAQYEGTYVGHKSTISSPTQQGVDFSGEGTVQVVLDDNDRLQVIGFDHGQYGTFSVASNGSFHEYRGLGEVISGSFTDSDSLYFYSYVRPWGGDIVNNFSGRKVH